MQNILIISGPPGAGKSTVATLLGQRSDKAVVIETDKFYHFIVHQIDPSLPESNAQNQAVIRAYMAAAQAYENDGYDVIVEGVIGTWWLDLLRECVPQFDFVLLHAPLDVTAARVDARNHVSEINTRPEAVAIMHEKFAAIEGFANHTISTDGVTPEVIVEEITARHKAGDLTMAND